MKTYRNHLYGDHMINFNPGSIMCQPSPLVDSHSKISSNFQDTITSVPSDLLDQDLDKSESDCNFSSYTSLQICCMNQSYNTSMYKFIIILQTVEKVVKDSAASWILKTKECLKLPQSILETIIEDVTSLFQFVHDNMHQYAVASNIVLVQCSLVYYTRFIILIIRIKGLWFSYYSKHIYLYILDQRVYRMFVVWAFPIG